MSLFDAEGDYHGNLITNPYDAGISVTMRGVRLTPYGLLFDSHAQELQGRGQANADSVPYQVRRWADGTESKVLEFQVAAYPHDHMGARFRGPNQAVPLWDVAGSCTVASDGASPWLVVASLDGRDADTLAIDLPDREPAGYDRSALAELSAMAGGGRHIPEPTAIRRISGLILDPDGHVWLLPIQPDPAPEGGVEILRISIATGEMVVDTVPAFPAAFGPPGVYFATPRAPLDEPVVARLDMAAEGGAPITMLL